ncbi:carbohydrate kinase family protein [Ferruginibacter lapsinanis]|uniref:carbohydrate kinase family protein n=1 Tax=Ferruginibacter lapsinanis TaxID=563172 RepID=UPI001E34EF77|nr:carbohydrate kinase family protein [Ferruginibacter lapsinanis]UEG51239.1 carbohydrate kinase family protein [Ferruginibacter lapsinanis]
MKKILILGGTTFDHIVTLDKFPDPIPKTIHTAPFHEAAGSTGAGKALCLTKLGVPNVLHSIVGDDIWGKKIISYLSAQKVDFIYDIDPKGTERHFNVMNAAGERISMFITQSSETLSINLALIEEKIKWADIVVLNIIPYCKLLIPLLKKYDKPVWTDLHDYDEGNPYHDAFIDAAQHIFLSSDNVRDYKSLMQQFIQDGKEFVVCTHGKNGATILTKDGLNIDQPAITTHKLVDANGAGDNFFGGFLYAFIQNKSISDCMKYATICGSYCIQSKELVHENLSAAAIEKDLTNWK